MITINELAKLVGGTVSGDGASAITGMVQSSFAGKGDLTFAITDEDLETTRDSGASCVVTTLETSDFPKTILKVKDIKESLTIIYNAMMNTVGNTGKIIHPTAAISESASLGYNVQVGAFVFIGDNTKIGNDSAIGAGCVVGSNVTIGNGVKFYPNVTIYDRIKIGDNVILHGGTVIGADGFGYIPKGDKILKVPQLASVIIENNVEIGANSCVDRGTFTDTVIGEGTKIDNLVQIAHNVKIGKNVFLVGQTGVAGSSTIGDNTMIAGQSGISDHINVGKNVKIGAKSAVIKDVKDGEVVFGAPARDAREALKQIAFMGWLYKRAKEIKELLKK